MVVFYLQQIKLMPIIKDVQKDVEPKLMIDGFEVQYDETRTLSDYKIEEMNDFRAHFVGFFKYFYDFPFASQIICPYHGKAFSKFDYPVKIDCDHPVTIAAPLLRRTNCGKYLTNLDITRFIEACRVSIDFLENFKAPRESFYDDFEIEHKWYH
jgi:hypothetical protein